MRIFGLLLFGLSSICFLVLTVLFFSFYNAFFQTEYLFNQYKSTGVYSNISSVIRDQVDKAQESSESDDPSQAPPDQMQTQIQQTFVNALFSEQSVEDLIEKNLVRFKEFLTSDQDTFTAYTPFNDSSMTDNMLSQMGMNELTQDPEFKKMFQESSKSMMTQNNPFQTLSPLAKNLRTSLNIMKIILPVFTLISLALFILIGRGKGRLRNVGILSIIISFSLCISYFLWRMVYFMSTQSGGWGEQNIGTQVASGILAPIILISTDIVGKCAIFSFVIGIVCIVIWIILKMNKPVPVKKAPQHKKRT
jgi:hypothetical protein